MTPVLVNPPEGRLVDLAELKDHLNIYHHDDDLKIDALEQAAVAYLEGWTGVLGRCIREQTWKISVSECGTFFLPFPDVTEVEGADWDQANRFVIVAKAGDVTFVCKMPDHVLPTIRIAVKLWVEIHFGALDPAQLAAAERTLNAIIEPLRCLGWRT